MKHYQKEYKNYQEDDGESIQVQLGYTRVTKFSAKSGFTKIRGVRATTLSSNRSITFFAYCPEDSWGDFEPVYMHMLNSMRRGVEKPKY